MERVRSIDLARGFTVLFIPAIHTGMLYSNTAVHHSALGKFLIAIAEGPGGQLLMLLMGLSFTFQAVHSSKQVFIKALMLMAAGYVLNILKFSIPYCLDLLPGAVLHDLNVGRDENALQQLSGIGDILQFSSLALVALHLVYKCRHFQHLALLTAAAITCCSPFLWDLHSDNELLNYLLNLISGQPPTVFFPLLPWLAYPLTGLSIGYYFQTNPHRTMIVCGAIGMLLIITGLTLDELYPLEYTAGFYRTPPAATLWHMGIVLSALFIWHMIDQQYSNNLFFRLLMYSSRNITILYFIQWVLICWLLPLFGYRELNTLYSSIVMLGITINTYLLTFTFQLLKQHYERSRNL